MTPSSTSAGLETGAVALASHRRREPHDLDRAVGGAHAAADGAALEGRAGGGGGGEQPVAVGEHDLAVRADVDEQPDPLVAVHARGEHAGDDVAADVRAQGREDHGRRPRVDRDARGRRRASTGSSRPTSRTARRPAARGRSPAPAPPSWRCRPARPRRRGPGRPRPRRTPRRSARASVAWAAARSRPSASGSSMVAEIRLITSPPYGCCLLSIDATAPGVPVSRSSRVATTVVVPRSNATP